ncbi:hypothetical protein JNUCC1_00500 [Lentibacillus sp. JNUCC-1]|nr:hypothetical protein [Lentibacillus sp. JNUCC-1]
MVLLCIMVFIIKTGGEIQMENWVSFVTEVGFPIAVTFYLLHRIEGKLNVLIESIHAIPDQLKV